MKSAVALRHLHFEDLGTLESVLRERDFEIRYLDAPRDDLASFDALTPDLVVVLGGPVGAFDEPLYPFLADELAVIRRRLAAGRPLLGICLGAQLIARALGAHVYPLGVKEIGFSPLSLSDAGHQSPLRALAGVPVLHWHGDQFDIPAGAVHLAQTKVGVNQAFAVGNTVLGLQFHLEADPRSIEQWLVGHASELAAARVDPRVLRAQACHPDVSRLPEIARKVVSDWLDALA